MAEQPLPNLDEIPDTPPPAPKAATPKPAGLPTVKPPKLPTIERPTITLARVPWRVVGVAAAVLAVVGTASFVLFFWKAHVVLTANPADARITFKDQAATGSLSTVVPPGTYPVRVERQDFIPYHQDLVLGINQRLTNTVTLRALPEPHQLSDKIVQFMVLDPDRTSLLFLAPGEQTAFRLFLKDLAKPTLDGITPASLSGVTNFVWSPNRQLAFMKLGEATKQYDFKRYDLVNQETHDWPAGVGSIDWRHDGEKVAYDFEPAGGERTIIRATKDNGDQERIFNLVGTNISHPTLSWSPDDSHLALVTTQLHILDVFSKQLKTVDSVGAVKRALWLPTSTGLIVQGADDALSVVTLEGAVTPLGLSGSIDQLTPFADGKAAVFTRERNSKTEFFRLDLATKALAPYLFKAQAPLAPTNLVLSKDEQTIFFVSAGHPTALTLDLGAY